MKYRPPTVNGLNRETFSCLLRSW